MALSKLKIVVALVAVVSAFGLAGGLAAYPVLADTAASDPPKQRDVEQLRAENEQLRQELQKARDELKRLQFQLAALKEQAEAARREAERQRALAEDNVRQAEEQLRRLKEAAEKARQRDEEALQRAIEAQRRAIEAQQEKARQQAEEARQAALQGIRQGANRQISVNNLKQIALAMHNYHDANKRLPAAAVHGKDGKPLLSWRVLLLPYLEENDLFKQFKLDEPWDGPNNKKLLEKMPKIYAPLGIKTKEPHSTFYQVFTGPGTIFDSPKGIRLVEITDGTANTIMVIEAGEPVPWTKPDDLPYDPKKPLPKLGGLFDGGFHIALADASVRFVQKGFDEPMLRLAITRADGEVVDLDKLNKKKE